MLVENLEGYDVLVEPIQGSLDVAGGADDHDSFTIPAVRDSSERKSERPRSGSNRCGSFNRWLTGMVTLRFTAAHLRAISAGNDPMAKSLADYLTRAGEHEVAQLFTEQA